MHKGIAEELRQLDFKIDSLKESNEKILNVQMEILRQLSKVLETTGVDKSEAIPDAMALLSLPGSLRKTVLALYKLGKATAEDLAAETSRLRGMESAYANRLARLGYLKKKRVGRKVVFYIEDSDMES